MNIDNTTRRLTLVERANSSAATKRDCRSCRAFRPSDNGLAFGWCEAFQQYVKLYHPPGEFWSQCQFKLLSQREAGERESAF